MYLEKILCAGIFLFFAGVVANIATLVAVIKHTHEDAKKQHPISNIAENFNP
jgi:hypothetical protein